MIAVPLAEAYFSRVANATEVEHPGLVPILLVGYFSPLPVVSA
jgi:hypothetical protein